MDKYGRRTTIIANALFFTLGALLIAATSSFSLILLGRFILGFAVSLSAIAECIYISEISTPERRGALVSLNELGITVGILVSFLVNYIFAECPSGWRYAFALRLACQLNAIFVENSFVIVLDVNLIYLFYIKNQCCRCRGPRRGYGVPPSHAAVPRDLPARPRG